MPIKGGARMYSILGEPRRACLLVETELDAILAQALAGDLVTVMSTGSAQWSPDEHSEALLRSCVRILGALDNDKAGIERSWRWWDKHYPNHKRWPTPKRLGKDRGDAWAAGLDVRAWVKAGLPPVLLLEQQPKAAAPVVEQARPRGMPAAETALRRLDELERHPSVQAVREVLDEHPVWIATRVDQHRTLAGITVDCDPRWWGEYSHAPRTTDMIWRALDHDAVWEWVELQGGKKIAGRPKGKRGGN